ncbi:hypothetical protein LY474_11235 [Myxococcus stipitatus]|uniref:hypothetical protein n=1 Tax=Myxococcus stipitatus TaxID=83455 RepID=UPI001F467DA4|nr:hypothetical protein [Myxococcus stipitatus]MCE9668386.1 hypothetical protein [Myxococcus stipitatus]
MTKALMLVAGIAVLNGCATSTTKWKGDVVWPDEQSTRTDITPTEAGAALAAAGAIREVVRTNPFPNLFEGCSSPEQGLDVSVFKGPTQGLYFVTVEQRFHRCGGPSGRVLDWWEVYAVTSQGDVVAKAPPPTHEPVPAPVPVVREPSTLESPSSEGGSPSPPKQALPYST